MTGLPRVEFYDFLSTQKKSLYLTHKCVHAYIKGANNLCYENEEGVEQKIKLDKLRRLVLVGHICNIDCEVLYKLLWKNIPVDFIDIWGRCIGNLVQINKNADYFSLRQEQFESSKDALECARLVLLAKVLNQKETIRRRVNQRLSDINHSINRIKLAKDEDQLRGGEGYIARLYFKNWKTIVDNFDWNGRVMHPAIDPVNSMLSIGYSILCSRLCASLRCVGLNPQLGFFHQIRGKNKALAYDLMEQFRPFVDTTVLAMIRTKKVRPEKFGYDENKDKVTFKDDSFRVMINAFEKMFCNTVSIYASDGYTSTIVKRTLNDLLDDCAENFAQYLKGKASFLIWSKVPCNVI